jgi:5-deoxy-glucuronate isomerase
MNTQFGYPAYDADGVQHLTDTSGTYKDALMDTFVCRLNAGETRRFLFPDAECAFLLIEGSVTFSWNGQTVTGSRESCFDDGAQVCALHVPRNTPVILLADRASEIFVASTENPQDFPARFYSTGDIRNVTSCANICDGTCERKVTTVFDDVTAPYSNLVLGETFPLPGKWCGYPPHSHPQPEVYYYRIDRPEGFGFCCVGDDVYKIKDRSFSLLAHGAMHPQVTAPGYHMYIIWVIRHLPGDPWHRGPNLPEYQWLEK